MLAPVYRFMGTDVLRFAPVQLRLRQIAPAILAVAIFAALPLLPSATVTAQPNINVQPNGAQPVPAAAQDNSVLTYPHPGMQAILDGGTNQVGRNEAASDEQIQRWVRDLDADVFAVRKLATAELAEVGKRMVPVLLQEMIDRDSLEQRHRGFQILETMAVSKKIDDESAAFDALRELAKSSERSLHSRAFRTLDVIKVAYRGRAAQRLLAKGAILDRNYLYGAQNVNFVRGRVVPGAIINSSGGNRLIFNDRWEGDASDLAMLQFLSGIDQVELEGEKIDDSFLDAIAGNNSLRSLKIRKSNVTDAGFARLKGLPELSRIDVRYTKITDKSLDVLATLKLARDIRLLGTDIAPRTPKQLQKIFPNANVDIRRGGFLGVGPQNKDIDATPCIVGRPEPNSAAERAGLISGDIVLKYNETPVTTFTELRNQIAGNIPGDEIAITIRRGKSELVKKAVLGEWTDRY